MKSIMIIWFIIFALVAVSLFAGKVPFWVPVALWLIAVFVRAKEKIGNFSDTEKKNMRDEKLQLTQKSEEMAERGLAYSGFRNQEEQKIKEDFEFERKKAKRKLWIDLVDTLFLK